MRRLAALFLLAFPVAASGQIFRSRDNPHACDGEPSRSTAIGATIGGLSMFTFAFLGDADRRISPSERLPYAWGVAAGALLSGAVEHTLAGHRCPAATLAVPIGGVTHCRGAAWWGGVKGAALGGVTAFVFTPILALPFAVGAAIGGRRLQLGRAMGIGTAVGAAVGIPVGAVTSYRRCAGR